MSHLPVGQLLLAAQQYLRAGQSGRGIQSLQQAIKIDPQLFTAHSLLGIALHSTGNFEAAIHSLRSAIALQNNWADGHELLGRCFAGSGLYEQAAKEFRETVRFKPDHVEALNNLGTILRSLGQRDEAISHLRTASELRPDQAEIRYNLGNALLENGDLAEAQVEFEQAIAIKPGFATFHLGHGNALIAMGQIPAAIDCFRRGMGIDPADAAIHSALLLCLHYDDSANQNPTALYEEHLEFNRRHIQPLAPQKSCQNDPDPHRRLRIGYVSADFRRHSVACFLEPLLSHHDQSQFELFCYADVANPDAVTDRLKQHTSHWRNVTGISNAQLFDQIKSDRIDILIDLAGHSGGGRLALFGRRPAPVQITYLGYPDTTGLFAIDARITDSIVDPPGDADLRSTEKLIRLTPRFLCFEPPADALAVAPPPCETTGHITFGSFNNLAKISPGTVHLWSGVLKAVPESRLLLKARGLRHRATAARLIQAFAAEGIESNCLQFLGHETSAMSHLARYHQVDVALDTFPYNGVTTTCEALWMGVAVISLAGKIHASRVGASLLTSIGCPQWAAETPDRFVQIAAGLAADRKQLAVDRATLRTRLLSSPITHGAPFTRAFEAHLRQLWQQLSIKCVDSMAIHRL